MSMHARFGDGQVVTAVGLILFSVLLLVANILDPTRGNLGNAALDIADVAAHPQAFLASTVLVLVSTIALLGATAGLWRVARTRSRRLTDIGAGLVALGALGHAALVTFNGFLYEMRSGDPAEMMAMLDRVNNGAVLLMVFPMLLALAVGLIILTIALRRSGMVPTWCLIAVCLIFLMDFFGRAVPGASSIVYVLNTLTYGWIAIIVLRMPAETWNEAGRTTEGPRELVHQAA